MAGESSRRMMEMTAEQLAQINRQIKELEHKVEVLTSLLAFNVLYGKKYAVIGDSFTHGDFSLSGVPDEDAFDPQTNTFKTYPWWIAQRNHMQLVNLAANGSTLTDLKDFPEESFFARHFSRIPLDADYLTIYYGINDSHKHAPIGTPDDDTASTFCGAWNRLLRYLLENCPRTKVGVIVSNGCDSTAYPTATITMCRKWGIPYLDLNGNDCVPLLHRVGGKPWVCKEAHQIMAQRYIVSDRNWHPSWTS